MDDRLFTEAQSQEVLESFLRGTFAKFADTYQDLETIRSAYRSHALTGFQIVLTAKALLDGS